MLCPKRLTDEPPRHRAGVVSAEAEGVVEESHQLSSRVQC